jgi:hypothetical protein
MAWPGGSKPLVGGPRHTRPDASPPAREPTHTRLGDKREVTTAGRCPMDHRCAV